jgi:hypothetical protein
MEIVNRRLQALAHEQKTMLETEDLYDKDGIAAGTKVTIRLPYKIVTL